MITLILERKVHNNHPRTMKIPHKKLFTAFVLTFVFGGGVVAAEILREQLPSPMAETQDLTETQSLDFISDEAMELLIPKTSEEYWEEMETEQFATATREGRQTLVITHPSGEKRYYYYFATTGGWTQAQSEQQMLELAEASQGLTSYFSQQDRIKADGEQIDLQRKLMMIERGIPLEGTRYSSDVRVDESGSVYISDNQGNYIICTRTGEQTKSCRQQ